MKKSIGYNNKCLASAGYLWNLQRLSAITLSGPTRYAILFSKNEYDCWLYSVCRVAMLFFSYVYRYCVSLGCCFEKDLVAPTPRYIEDAVYLSRVFFPLGFFNPFHVENQLLVCQSPTRYRPASENTLI